MDFQVHSMDFYDHDPDADMSLAPDGPENCMRIVRAAAHALTRGEIPECNRHRLGLLMAAIAQLAITVHGSVEEAVAESDEDDHDHIRRRANEGLSALIAAAVCWAEPFVVDDSLNHVAYGD